jgi:hypothetical protein
MTTDENRTGLPPGHRVYRRRRFLESVPLPGEGDPALRGAAEGEKVADDRPLPRRGGRTLAARPTSPGAA